MFKKIMLLFWALWWSIALWTDVVGGLAHVGWLHASWAPDSNYPFLEKSLRMYNVSPLLIAFLFIGILVWSFLSALYFWWATFAWSKPMTIWLSRVEKAFIISLSYWLAFFLADQWVMNFDLEENHMVQGGFQLLSFLAIYLLPDKISNSS